MMTRNRIYGMTGMLLTLGTAASASAQTPAAEAQNKLLARRAAEADCYRKLAETVYGVRINSDTFVRDFVTESDEIRSAVDAFVTGIRLGSPRYYEDGTCEVDAEVTVARLVTKLSEIHTAHYRGSTVTRTDIEHLEQSLRTKVIRVTGAGAPRPELPPELPIGTEDVITPLPAGVVLGRSIPAIWKTVGGQARLMAERAAELDAMRKLLEQIKGLRLTSTTLVRDFVTESDEIRTHADGIVRGASVAGKYLHRDELIAEVTMEVPVEKVITRVKELHSEYYHGNRVTTTDITNIKKSVKRRMISATGSGVPPARFVSQAASAGFEAPSWFTTRIRATGEATDPEMSTAQGRLRARRAARVIAMRNLAEQINGLQIRSDTTVRDFVTGGDNIRAQVDAIVTRAVEENVEFTGDVVAVTMSLPGGEVWSVIHQHMLIVQRRD